MEDCPGGPNTGLGPLTEVWVGEISKRGFVSDEDVWAYGLG